MRASYQALQLALVLLGTTTACGGIVTNVITSTGRSSSANNITTPAFTTTSGNQLLLAFIATDAKSAGITVTSVTGGGLTWVLVQRANAQFGTAEIWRAFARSVLASVTVRANLSQSVAASITVVTLGGVDTSGANGAGAIGRSDGVSSPSGAPSASLVTTRDGSWVFGVGTDWDNPIARTVGANQTLVYQFFPTVGDTYWVQRQSAPTPLSGTQVFINDTAPTADRYNLSIVEVLPAVSGTATFTIAGAVSPAANGNGATMTLTQGATAIGSVIVNSSGNYAFTGLSNGTYTVTPNKSGFNFTPPSTNVTINGSSQTANFSATPQVWVLSGTVSPLGSGALLTLSGAHGATATADASGNFSFPGLTNGNYAVTPSKAGFTFSPTSQPVTINGGNSNVVFTAAAVPTWTISGTVSPAAIGSGTLLTLSGARSATTNADASGNFSFTGLANGNYTVTPSKTGDTFNPANQPAIINGANMGGVNFTAQLLPVPTNYPDLSDIIPPGQISIVGTGTNRQFQYTHDTLNGGSGPLEILPVYNPASGNYQGYQHIYSFQSGTWTLVRTIPVAGAFVFDSAHGHFHFPFAAYGLYSANPDGSIGALVAMSPKTGFCIGDSFIYDPSLPNAGAFGNWGSCADPTSMRGLSIGAVDEYDQTDEGQSIPIPGLPDGIYWLRSMVDPYNYLAESDESNNVTETKLAITGNTVTVLQTVKPVLTQPPDVSLTSPTAGVISGIVQLAVGTLPAGVGSVQFLVDGLPFGNVITNLPYSLAWDTTAVPSGAHWLAAMAADATGHIGTSPVIQVTVNNSTTIPPSVQLTDPAPGSTVSAVITVSATATAQIGLPSVQFYVDNVAFGSPVTAPPYMTTWNTETVSAGPHVITAVATDPGGLVGNSGPVSVTVDNSHPANPLGTNVLVFVDSSGTMQTPAFSTASASTLLVAFVAYDGPAVAPQTATVSGAGLAWQLAKRSNAQLGTAEIWVAKATNFLSSVTVTSQPGSAGYHGSLTVIGFTNASGPGVVGQASAPSGAPDIFLPGVLAGNWVFAVGNDWDGAVARTPVSGQVLVHQRVDTQTGDTFWVQSTAAPSTADALVDIHDSTPTNDQWNYAAVEIVATRQ